MVKVAGNGIPVGVSANRDLREELAYGNHQGVRSTKGKGSGRLYPTWPWAEHIEGSRISPVGLVEEKGTHTHNPLLDLWTTVERRWREVKEIGR